MARSRLLLLHRYSGLVIALFLVIAGITGAILAFSHEIDAWLNEDWFHVQPSGTPLPWNEITDKVTATYIGQEIRFIDLKREPHESLVVTLGPPADNSGSYVDQLFVNPYTGQILGARQAGAFDLSKRGIMPFLFHFHYTLHLPENWGRWLMGGIALVWLLDCFVGFYLTLPRQSLAMGVSKFRSRWSSAWKIKWRSGPLRANYDAHRASGLWLWGLLFITAFSSVFFNLHEEVYRPVASLVTSFTPHPAETLPQVQSPAGVMDWGRAIARGYELRPESAANLPASYISYSRKQNVYRISFDERAPNTWFKFRREQIFFDGTTGEMKGVYGYDQGTAGDKFNSWQFPLHTGQMFGLPGRILIMLTGLVTAGLSITGVYIWYRKSRARRVFKPVTTHHNPQFLTEKKFS